ncbi:MAG: phosphodiester glycosidase family protein [Clostridia bacterium]|nr:phosphodiester glycosidase family protein [Clostridia bacterium]
MLKQRPKPLWLVIILDILLTGIVLVVFAYFHHVRPSRMESENIIIARPTAPATVSAQETPAPEATLTPASTAQPEETPTLQETPSPERTPEPTQTPEPEPDPPGVFANKFADKFTQGEVIRADGEDGTYRYQSKNLNIAVTKDTLTFGNGASVYECTYYITDIYISNINCFQTCFAQDQYGSGFYEWTQSMAARTNAVVAINGDYYGNRQNGVVIRNGVMYRSKHSTFDACVINWDGTMLTYQSKEWDSATLVKNGAYQAWSFGPELLDENGRPCKSFNATNAVKKKNPRTAIGYFEPGHYCFVTVDGRSETSRGITFEALAQLMSDIGCVQAYNLDGGESTMLTWGDRVINEPSKDGRKISDAVMIVDVDA